jgi:hypothetical protein
MSGPTADDVRSIWPRPEQPEFNPAYLVVAVVRLLERGHEIAVRPGSQTSPTAIAAAADLLRALGVKPASAPAGPAWERA